MQADVDGSRPSPLRPTPSRRDVIRIDPARRRWIRRVSTTVLAAPPIAAASPIVAAALLAPRGAHAHHGYAGAYDFSRPLYLAGTIDAIWIGLPHVRLRLRLDPDLSLPRDREPYRAVEDAEARQMLGRLRLPERRGVVDVVLHARMSRPLMSEPEALPEGLHTEIIGYQRTTSDEYRGEIVGVLVRLQDGRMLVASMRLRRER